MVFLILSKYENVDSQTEGQKVYAHTGTCIIRFHSMST